MGPHVASLGMRFYQHNLGKMFPKEYNHSIFVAQRGSYNRKNRIGYR
jgi:glucose/arabinose dehydrogenase